METSNTRNKRPLLITFIGDLCLINAFFVLASLFPTPNFLEQFGFFFIPLSNLLDCLIRISSFVILLLISYGFLKIKKWGYSLMITYNFLFLGLSIICLTTKNTPFNLSSDFIPSLIALIIAFPSKRYFS